MGKKNIPIDAYDSKSYLATALGYQACMLGYRVMYANTAKLLSRMKMAKANGTYIREMAKIERQQLLILDDFGLQTLDNLSRQAIMEIIEDRHEKGSTIVTSQLPVKQWSKIPLSSMLTAPDILRSSPIFTACE